jgi:hypothetical protein
MLFLITLKVYNEICILSQIMFKTFYYIYILLSTLSGTIKLIISNIDDLLNKETLNELYNLKDLESLQDKFNLLHKDGESPGSSNNPINSGDLEFPESSRNPVDFEEREQPGLAQNPEQNNQNSNTSYIQEKYKDANIKGENEIDKLFKMKKDIFLHKFKSTSPEDIDFCNKKLEEIQDQCEKLYDEVLAKEMGNLDLDNKESSSSKGKEVSNTNLEESSKSKRKFSDNNSDSDDFPLSKKSVSEDH